VENDEPQACAKIVSCSPVANEKIKRRQLIKSAVQIFPAAGLLAASIASTNAVSAENSQEDVTPVEDLMREHGALNRLLIIYEFILNKISADKTMSPKPLIEAATLMREFVENYHEKTEETYLFPRFEKAGKLQDLVAVLKNQHDAGRQLTGLILSGAKDLEGGNAMKKVLIVAYLNQFVRMYRPHEAREDTILFPAFKTIVSPAEYKELGEKFEDEETRLFGKGGFEKNVDKIAAIEKDLGIYDLAQFTPKDIPSK
jgi:hemerythrin-like domain-containing protein